ncbi:MAG TPA: 6-carboxytetrahydropterin synthase, partial [Thermodesulfobacteriota bacterium]|nr:6-carboxytetrahydropterin synthase [Thermodesulfobacteriota bacterium]
NLDHKYLNEISALTGKNPSSENLAAYIFGELSREMDAGARRLAWVSVGESETSIAVCRRPGK